MISTEIDFIFLGINIISAILDRSLPALAETGFPSPRPAPIPPLLRPQKHPIDFLIERALVPNTIASLLSETCRIVREPIGMVAIGHGLLECERGGAYVYDEHGTPYLDGVSSAGIFNLGRRQVKQGWYTGQNAAACASERSI